jgi:hypothetical protein
MSTANTPTTEHHPPARVTGHPRDTASRAGHAVAAVVNLVILFLLNVRPGWEALPFLTVETTQVLDVVNLSLWVTVVAELSYVLVRAAPWRAAGDAVTTGVGLAAIVRIWQVFPFDLGTGWEVVARVLLAVAAIGSVVGVAVALSRFVTSLVRAEPED